MTKLEKLKAILQREIDNADALIEWEQGWDSAIEWVMETIAEVERGEHG